ncbi:hypothetical protein J6590_039351 [Homalodisca vitripennis]|nr:hypothetical protein J6590_039351 [Homalodisca vitripennis]
MVENMCRVERGGSGYNLPQPAGPVETASTATEAAAACRIDYQLLHGQLENKDWAAV